MTRERNIGFSIAGSAVSLLALIIAGAWVATLGGTRDARRAAPRS